MIGRLRGRIDDITEDTALIDVGGVGYVVFASSRTLGALSTGEAASLIIETHVREDHIHLYGFLSAEERDMFRLLTTVQGVGAKMALSIQSLFDAESLMRAIAAQDKTALTRASGVGPKLAERIITELKNKVGKMAIGIAPAAPSIAGKKAAAKQETRVVDDALSALVHLGYGRSEAYSALQNALREADNPTIDALIKSSLRELAL